MKNIIHKIIPGKLLPFFVDLKNKLLGRNFKSFYYSQSGEDIILKGIFSNDKKGVFLGSILCNKVDS